MKGLRLYKYEKLCSKKEIEILFAANSNSVKSYPIRLIYHIDKDNGTPAKFFISVPKRKLHHAVDRVTVRRRIREAYRLNRSLITNILREKKLSVNIAFIYMNDEVSDYAFISDSMTKALTQLSAIIEQTEIEQTEEISSK